MSCYKLLAIAWLSSFFRCNTKLCNSLTWNTNSIKLKLILECHLDFCVLSPFKLRVSTNTYVKDLYVCLFVFHVTTHLIYYTWVLFHKHLNLVFVHLTTIELKSRHTAESVSSIPQKFEKSEHSKKYIYIYTCIYYFLHILFESKQKVCQRPHQKSKKGKWQGRKAGLDKASWLKMIMVIPWLKKTLRTGRDFPPHTGIAGMNCLCWYNE